MLQWKKRKAGYWYSTQEMYSAVRQKTGVWFLYRAKIYISYSYRLGFLKELAQVHWQKHSRT